VLLFESSTNDPWDGKNKEGKDVPEGTYFYVIDAEIMGCDGNIKQNLQKVLLH
jgi:flagellar hook assembly protein FlgD